MWLAQTRQTKDAVVVIDDPSLSPIHELRPLCRLRYV